MISYEQPGKEKWLSLEHALLYELKVNTMTQTQGHHGNWCLKYIIEKELEIRKGWKKKMIQDGDDFDTAVKNTIQMNIWPTEREIINESKRSMISKNATQNHPNGPNGPPAPSGPFEGGGTPDRRPSTPAFDTVYRGRPSWRQNDNRPFRWVNKRHEICLKWQDGSCKYSATECNRAHGKEYLIVKTPHIPKGGGKGEKGGKDKGGRNKGGKY